MNRTVGILVFVLLVAGGLTALAFLPRGDKPGIPRPTTLREAAADETKVLEQLDKHIVTLERDGSRKEKPVVKLILGGLLDDDALAPVAGLPSLEHLTLAGTRVTDAGLKHL